MLELINISRKFNGLYAVNNISFQATEGKIFGILGPNGAGKTTTLRIILRILAQDEGEIKYNGSSLPKNFHEIVGYLPEERGLYKYSKVKNVLRYFGKLKNFNSKNLDKRIINLLELFEIKDKFNSHIGELSKGNQQKIQFISAMIHDPKILILDEPFSGFDPIVQETAQHLINSELRNNKIILVSTHNMEQAEKICDEFIILNEGKVLLHNKMNNILKENSNSYYKLIFENRDEKERFSKNHQIFSNESDSLIYDIRNLKPAIFIKELSSNYKILEVTKVSNSLRNVFLNLIKPN